MREKLITVVICGKARGPVEVVIEPQTVTEDLRVELKLPPTFKILRTNGEIISEHTDIYDALEDKEIIRLCEPAYDC